VATSIHSSLPLLLHIKFLGPSRQRCETYAVIRCLSAWEQTAKPDWSQGRRESLPQQGSSFRKAVSQFEPTS
jgi:hypothetical protein